MLWEWRFLLNINHNQPIKLINKLVNAAVWWPTTAIRQNDINLLILDWTLIILNLKWSKSKTKNYFIELEIDLFFLIFNSKQNIFIMKWK